MINTPVSSEQISRGSVLVISWSPVQAAALVEVKGAIACCTGTTSCWAQTLASDTGTVTVPAGTFTEPSATCDLLITVDRTLQGSIDLSYGGGGKIIVHQSRFVTVKSIL